MDTAKADFDMRECICCYHKRWTWAALANLGLLAMLGFVWIGLAMAWGAAGWRWCQTASSWNEWESLGVGLMLVWTATVAIVLHWVQRRWGNKCFIATAVLLTLLVGTGWAWASRRMTVWPMDSGLFRWFLERLAEGGFSVENLRTLAGVYDYPVWTRRSLPFCLLLYQWVGAEHFVWMAQLVQVAICAVGVVLAWRVAKLLCGEKAAHWTAMAMVAMPGYPLQVVGLNHQVWGSLWFLMGWWLLAEWTFGEGGARCKVGLALVACMLVPVVRLAGFAGTMYLLCALCVLLFGFMYRRTQKRRVIWALVCLVAVPTALSEAILQPLSQRIAEANPEPIRGGQLAFAARGWDCREWGEYVVDGEWLDILTPPECKNRFFQKYIAGQCVYNGWTLVTRLFPVKLAKFMLTGYASLAEEVLWANGAERTGRMARGMRVGWFVLLYAPLMLWGLCRLSRRVGNGDVHMVWLLLPIAMFGVAVMVAGETSPRYSMPVQALLIAAGGCGWEPGWQGKSVVRWRYLMVGAGLASIIYLLFSITLLGMRGILKKYVLEDMRQALVEGGEKATDALQAPFVACIPNGDGGVVWPGSGGEMTVYIYGTSWTDSGRVALSCVEEEWWETNLPSRLELKWKAHLPNHLLLHRVGSSGSLHIGYAMANERQHSPSGP